ncbi:hypothetical protein D9M71_727740 [compost metagenome]
MGRPQPIDLARLPIPHPGPLATGIEITGEQQLLALRLDQQHTGILVAITGVMPLPEGKIDPVPLPTLAATARLRL